MTAFSQEVKDSVCAVKRSASEKVAELFGMIYSCEKFDGDGILFRTESECAMRRFCRLLSILCGLDAEQSVRKGARGKRFIFEGDSDAVKQISRVVPQAKDADISAFSKCGAGAAFIGGLFLGAGSVGDPSKAIYAEISIKNDEIIEPALEIFASLEIAVRISRRKTGSFFYFKTADDVSRLLFELGAKNQAFECINSNIERTVRNDANRAGNCDVANAKKQAASSSKHIEAARKLKKNKYFGLSDDLISVAEARLGHPELNIEQLGQTLSPPLSKSGTAYRLKKLVAAAESLKRQ